MANLEVNDCLPLGIAAQEINKDYKLAYTSRQVSLIGRREVMSGKAKFGIFGGGKELAQIAMAKVIRDGDFRSGYYRDQTLMFATGTGTYQEYFAQLFAHAAVEADPWSAGRQMNNHFATRSIDSNGNWNNLMDLINSSADISPVGSQMPRLVGLAYASRLYNEIEELRHMTQFSRNGKEIAFGTIGNGTCAEGMFWESLNAIGVLRSPSIITIYDDGYAISVPNDYAMVKQDISKLLSGFQRRPETHDGFEIFVVHGWDYPNLVKVFRKAEKITRQENVPSIIHVIEMTQPQGHSTSGSHERYKPQDRLDWEIEHDCISRFRAWILSQKIATPDELDQIELESKKDAESARKNAWEAYTAQLLLERNSVAHILSQLETNTPRKNELINIKDNLLSKPSPLRRHTMSAILDALIVIRDENHPEKEKLIELNRKFKTENGERYGSHLYSQIGDSALHVPVIEPVYQPDSPTVNGYEVLNACFDAALSRDPRIIAFGQDVGRLGGVNQAFRGLQKKFGELRVTDTGVRELTIIGQAIGLAMRGLRPIAEIQYLDYLIYALQIISDDLATLRWRTAGGQKAPVIIRTRGHRLEGVWHSGSQLSGIINLVRGLHVIVPRNMTQAAGFYNTLLAAEEPGLIIEVLNGYRVKEILPANIGTFTIPLGIPEIIRHGSDITVVTYGATCQIVLEAADNLQRVGIDVEVIDVRTLLPFDINASILESLKKTGRIVFIDEDVPGGATAYMLQEVIERQGGYFWLDSEPHTLPGKAHRPAFGSDGDYWSKPNAEQIFETIYEIMNEVNPNKYPNFFS